mgnify:CR=1 FL=1
MNSKTSCENKEFFSIEQVAIYVVGGEPENDKFVAKNKREISFIEEDLITAVKTDIEIIRKLIASGYKEMEDGYDLEQDAGVYLEDAGFCLEDASSRQGVDFYKSLKKDDFSALNKAVHSTTQSIKLNVKEVKSWLKRHDIHSEFFFPDISKKEGKKTVLDMRIAELRKLTNEYGKHVLEEMTRIEVWELLHAKDHRLFKKFDNAEGGSVKELFDNQSILTFTSGRPLGA